MRSLKMVAIHKNGWKPPQHPPLKASAAYVRPRPTVSVNTPKSLYRCAGGPWHGQYILLSSPLMTIPFKIGEYFGYYKSSGNVATVKWESLL